MKIDMLPHWGSRNLRNIPEFCAKIIDGMTKDGKVLLHVNEGHNPKYNGLYELLDQLCDYYKWDKSKICIVIANPTFSHDYYQTISGKWYTFDGLSQPMVPVYPWNGEKDYGMFIGRVTPARIGALVKHLNFEFKSNGLTSFNGVIKNCVTEMTDYLIESDNRASMVENIQPYSDIDKIHYGPIWQDRHTTLSLMWSNVYKRIGIDIVCETSTEPESFSFSEKTLRPLFYKRPFLIVGCKGYVQYLKDYGIKTFEPWISDEYDQHEELHRVDRVFKILDDLIRNNKLKTIHERCQDIFEHNHQRIFELKKLLGTTVEEYQQFIESIPGY